MLSYKCYLNTVTRTVSKTHSYSPVMLSYKYYLNTVTRTVSKHTATVLSCCHINITLTQSHIAKVYSVFLFCTAFKVKVYIFNGKSISKYVSEATPIKYTSKIVCTGFELTPNIFLIRSFFNWSSINKFSILEKQQEYQLSYLC